MARPKNEKAEIAYNLYLQGSRLVDIAHELGVPEGTVRRWKCVHKWGGERSKDSERSKKTKKRTSAEEREVKALIENEELSDKEKLFCLHYIKYFNGAKAARAAGYEITRDRQTAYRLMHTPKIQAEIQRLKLGKLNRVMLDEDDIFQRMIDIAFADVTDFVEFRREMTPVMTAFGPLVVDGETVMKPVNRVWFRDSDNVDGTLISEIKQGKDGASIKLHDKMKALQWLSDRMDLLPTATRERIEIEKRKCSDAAEETLAKVDDILEKLDNAAK